MHYLTINAGSSSLKRALFADEEQIKHGQVDRIENLEGYDQAIQQVLQQIQGYEIGVVAHRVVHGGEYYQSATLIDDEVIQTIEKISYLAPLHNPANVAGIKAMKKQFPVIPHIGVFDTAFHQSMSPDQYLYAVPYEWYEQYGVRKYGFHGTSHQYVAQRLGELMQRDWQQMGIISCHIGNGASVTAIQNGKVVTTSMGLTPLAGLMMGTRSGDIDPSIFLFMSQQARLSVDQIDETLNKKSGVLGLSQKSSHLKDIVDQAQSGDEQAQMVVTKYVSSIVQYIGGYWALLDTVDAVVLTAGTMEQSPYLRGLVVQGLASLGVTLDEQTNDQNIAVEACVSAETSSVPVWLVPTDEELQMVRESKKLL